MPAFFFFMHLNNSLWSSNEFVLHIGISLPVPAMKGRVGSAEKLQHLTLVLTESRLNINIAGVTLTPKQDLIPLAMC